MGRNGTARALGETTQIRLREIAGSELAEALRVQLTARHPGVRPDEIEDAVQEAYLAVERAREPFTDRGSLYAWLYRAADWRIRTRRRDRRREVLVDFAETDDAARFAASGPTVEEEVIAREQTQQRRELVAEIVDRLSERQRRILAAHLQGLKRPEIAAGLGLSRRVVQRELEHIMRAAREGVGRAAGGGCDQGEAIVLRKSCGLATPSEVMATRSHLAVCERCQEFARRLDVWRDVASVLPAPVTGHAEPGRFSEVFAGLRQYLADAGANVKHHATSAYYRAADPTPLAGVRPGAAAAAIAGCVAVGTAGTVCVQQGEPPWKAATGLISPEPKRDPETPQTAERPEPQPSEPREPTPTTTPSLQSTPSEPAPEREPEPPPPPPKPEDSFEPTSPGYSSPAGSSTASASRASAPQPAPSATSDPDREFEP